MKIVSPEELLEICNDYFLADNGFKTFAEHLCLLEGVETSRYSIEVNYRTTPKEVLTGYAKLALGYISAALKNRGFHTKHVFDEKPLRLLVSSRNWDDGEWCGVISWNHEHDCFILSKGFYNRDRRTVSVQNSEKAKGDNASDISKEMQNIMNHLKDKPDRHVPKFKPVPIKPGPKI